MEFSSTRHSIPEVSKVERQGTTYTKPLICIRACDPTGGCKKWWDGAPLGGLWEGSERSLKGFHLRVTFIFQFSTLDTADSLGGTG